MGDGGGSGEGQAARVGALQGVPEGVAFGEAGAGVGCTGDEEGRGAGAVQHGRCGAVVAQHSGIDRRCRVYAHAPAKG